MAPRLEGQALLDRIAALGEQASAREQAMACGYVAAKGGILYPQFFKACAEARGHAFGRPYNHPGPKLSGRGRVNPQGALRVPQGYLKGIGLVAGDEFAIEVDREAGCVRLRPLKPELSGEAAAIPS